jgi:hypothetical protein
LETSIPHFQQWIEQLEDKQKMDKEREDFNNTENRWTHSHLQDTAQFFSCARGTARRETTGRP